MLAPKPHGACPSVRPSDNIMRISNRLWAHSTKARNSKRSRTTKTIFPHPIYALCCCYTRTDRHMLNLQLTTPKTKGRTKGINMQKYSNIPLHSLIRVMWCMDGHMQSVRIYIQIWRNKRSSHPPLWWSQLNTKKKASLAQKLPVHRTSSYDELPKSQVTSPKIFGGGRKKWYHTAFE